MEMFNIYTGSGIFIDSIRGGSAYDAVLSYCERTGRTDSDELYAREAD